MREPLFAFSGAAWYRPEMGAELYRAEPAFRDAVDRCCAGPALHDAPDVAACFRAELGGRRPSKLDELLTGMVLNIAQVDLWRASGVRPGAVLAVSVGELSAAYAAEILDRDETLRIARTLLPINIERDPHCLFGIEAHSPEAKLIARRSPCEMVFVGSVTPRSSMVLVPAADRDAGRRYLEETTRITKEMASEFAYHSPRGPTHREQLAAALGEVEARAAEVPCYLASEGGRSMGQAKDARFWAAISVRPFYLDDATASAVSDGWRQVLAIGPTDRLEPWLRATFDARGARMDFVPSMREGVPDLRAWCSAQRAIKRRRRRRGHVRTDAQVIDSYAEVRDALRSPERFSNTLPARLDRSMASLDSPHHDQQRAVVRRLLSTARGERLDQICEVTARDLLRPHLAEPEIDMVDVLATPLSERVLGRLLGLEGAQLQRFAEAARGPFGEGARRRVLAAIDALSPVPAPMRQVIEELGTHEGRDLLRMLWIAGTHTVRRGVVSTVRTLGSNGCRGRLIDSPRLIDAFVDEVLRLNPPEPTVRRREAGGDVVDLSLESANRDPGHFPNPLATDLERPPGHLAFGGGPHRCPGATIARAELAAVVRVILELMPKFELVHSPTAELLVRPKPVRELSSSAVAE